MKRFINRLFDTALYHAFLVLMPVGAILDMMVKLDFSGFTGKIKHSIVLFQFLYAYTHSAKKEGK